MTITNTTVVKSAVGGATDYSFPFRIFANTDIKVYTADSDGVLTLKTLTTDYTVAFVAGVEGGTVTFLSAPSASLTVYIVRETPNTQGTNYTKNQGVPAEDAEKAYDRATMQIQQNTEKLERSLFVKVNESLADPSLTNVVAGQVLVWNGAGDAVTSLSAESILSGANLEFEGTGVLAGTTLATLAIDGNTAAHIHAFASGLVGTSMEVFSLEFMISRESGTATITVINAVGGLQGGYLEAEQSGNNVVIKAYSATDWLCKMVVAVRSVSTVTTS